ncbi:MAG: DUF4345 domain-containing protein [Chryseolinea sp.]
MMTNKFARIFLGLMALAFCKVGVEAMVDPQAVVAQVGITLDNASAMSSIRAVYGGMHFAFGLLCFWSLLKRPAPALWLVVLYTSGFLAGRTISLLTDGAPNEFVLTWFGTEAFSLVASATLLLLLQQRRRSVVAVTA